MISEYIVFDTKHFIKKTLEREKILPELKRRYTEYFSWFHYITAENIKLSQKKV